MRKLLTILFAFAQLSVGAQLPTQPLKSPPAPKPVDPKAAQAYIQSQNTLNLTGYYRAECTGTSGHIYIRHVGNEIYWFGEDQNGQWSHVFSGVIQGTTIQGKFWDVPKGQQQLRGDATLTISPAADGSVVINRNETGRYYCTSFRKANIPDRLPPVRPTPIVEIENRTITGIWDCDDGATTYIYEDGLNFVFFSEQKTGGNRPAFSNVFVGKNDYGRITGKWFDVPKGLSLSNGIMTIQRTNNHQLTRTGDGSGYGGSVWKRPTELWGLVDMHTHPMSHLGFGQKALHGAPDVGCLLPAGTRNCNSTPIRAENMQQALGHCNSTHGGWGVDNTCGDYLRAGIINLALDGDFVHKSDNAHSDHHHDGFPDFRYWPHQSSILHQQMWWEWIKRAWEGGLRIMVALTVNSELLAELINGNQPYDDKYVADLQTDEMIAMVSRHSDFMEIAYSPADLRRIVSQGKLAVILGMEVDRLGNFGRPGVPVNETAIRNEINRLYRKGIRYIFPIHLIDNSFGGTAVYSMLFNFANKHANGYHFRVERSTDPNIKYRANLTDGPLGAENSLILGLNGLLQGIGQLPAPCFNDLLKCSPPPGKVLCCGSYQNVLNIMQPTPELDAYKFIPGGHVNSLGLTRAGEIAINEMMKLGMIIDIDHMSDKSILRALEIAESIPGGYPLNMGHNELRSAEGKERNVTPAVVSRLMRLGGMFGVGTANIDPRTFVKNYMDVWNAAGRKSLGIGTDVNGFERLPYTTRNEINSLNFYTGFFGNGVIKTKCKTGNKTWDYLKEGGVAHYGLLPEFLYDVKLTPLGGDEVYKQLMKSAESFAKMWERCEQQRMQVR